MIRLSYLSPKTEVREEHHGWIGFSEDDVGNRRRRKYQAGKPHANALRTTRSTYGYFA